MTLITANGYQWGFEVTELYDGGAERQQLFEGHSVLRSDDMSQFGHGWAPKNYDRILSLSGGVALVRGDGSTFWFEEDGGDYLPQAGDLSGIVYSTSGGAHTTDKWGNVTHFNSYGLPSELEDRYGNTVKTFAYDDIDSDTYEDDLVGYTDASGYGIEYIFEDGLLVGIVDSTGLEVEITIDEDGNLSEFILPDPDGAGPLTSETYAFEYDEESGLLVGYTTPAGETTVNYDFWGRVSAVTQPGDSEKQYKSFFAYGLVDLDDIGASQEDASPLFPMADAFGVLTDPFDNDIATKTDRFGRETEKTDQLGRKWTTDRDSEGRPETVITPDPDGVGDEEQYVSTYGYDAGGNLELITYPDETTEEWVYDLDFNVPTSYTDRLGNITLFTLDETFGYVLEERRVVGELDDEFNEETDDVVATYTYTAAPAGPSDPPAGLVATITDALGIVTELDYDEFGSLTSVIYAVGTDVEATVAYAYDEQTHWLTSITDELGRVTRFTHDLFGRVATTTLPDPDQEGPLESPVLTNLYDEEGNLWKTVDALGRETAFGYDERGNQIQIDRPDHDGDLELTTTLFAFNEANWLESMTDPLGRITTYGHDDAGQVTSVTLPDPDGPEELLSPVLETTYDDLGRVASTTDALENVTYYVYSDWGQTVTITLPDPDGAGELDSPVLVRHYDAAGNLVSETDALLNETLYEYDELGRLVLVTAADPDGAGELESPVTEYRYDKLGQLTQIIDPLGNRIVDDYDARGRKIAERHATGELPTIEIHTTAEASLLSEVQLVGYTVDMMLVGGTFTLTYSGQTTSAIDYMASAATVQAALEALSNIDSGDVSIVKTTNTGLSQIWQITFTGSLAGTNVSQTTIDASSVMGMMSLTETESTTTIGNMTSEVQLAVLSGAAGGTFRLVFDGQTTAPIDFDATTGEVDTALEALTNIDSVSVSGSTGGPFGITFTGSLSGQNVATLWPLGSYLTNSYDLEVTTRYAYDAAGQLLSLTDPDGNVTQWMYDDLGRVIEEVNELDEHRYFEYDAASNLTERTDRLERVIQFEYDALNNLVEENWLDGEEEVIRTLSYEFDAAGQLLSAGDPAASYAYTYDDLGRVTSETQMIDGLTFDIEYQSEYNANSLRTSLLAILDGTADFQNEYFYDDLSRLIGLTQGPTVSGNDVAEKRFDFAYNANSQLAQLTRYADLSGFEFVANTFYGYDNLSRFSHLIHTTDPTPPESGWGEDALAGYAYAYDDASRILSIDSYIDGLSEFNYDDTSQLTAADHASQTDEAYTYDANGNRDDANYDVDPNNQMSTDGTYNYFYDAEGNRSSRVQLSNDYVTVYQWDYRNRLVAVIEQDDEETVLSTVEYTYDLNNRLIRRVFDEDGPGGDPTAKTYFSWEHDQINLEFADDEPEDLSTRHLWNPAAIDQIMASEDASSLASPGDVTWPFTDHLGTPRDLASYNAGTDTTTLENHREFNSFGLLIDQTNGSFTIDIGFTGVLSDITTGLNYHRERWYDARMGRWTAEDPKEFDGADTNLARFVGNSPVDKTDPTGLIVRPPPIFGPGGMLGTRAQNEEAARSSAKRLYGGMWWIPGPGIIGGAPCPSGINVTGRGLSHVLARHFPGGAKTAGKSLFYATEDVGNLIAQASKVTPTSGLGTRLVWIANAGRNIGIDRATGNPTAFYTVITEACGDLVTAFPGTP